MRAIEAEDNMRPLTFGLAALIGLASTAAEAGNGLYAYDQALSQRRAEAVKAEMIRLGLSEDMIAIIGRGFDEPMDAAEDIDRLRQKYPVIIELGK
jgi:hypothetical protein